MTHFGQPVDDTPSILRAFELCGTNGTVVLTNNTFHIDQVMNTTNLLNCDIELHGEMVWSTNVPYWLSHSYSVVYANLSTAWFLGGTNVTFRGFGQGLFNGNGKQSPFRVVELSSDLTVLEQVKSGTMRTRTTAINREDPYQSRSIRQRTS